MIQVHGSMLSTWPPRITYGSNTQRPPPLDTYAPPHRHPRNERSKRKTSPQKELAMIPGVMLLTFSYCPYQTATDPRPPFPIPSRQS
jgi:hypothetical protein